MFCYYISIYIPDIRHQRLSNNTTGISTDDYSPGDLSSRSREKGRQGRRDLLVQIKSRTRLSASLEFLSKM